LVAVHHGGGHCPVGAAALQLEGQLAHGVDRADGVAGARLRVPGAALVADPPGGRALAFVRSGHALGAGAGLAGAGAAGLARGADLAGIAALGRVRADAGAAAADADVVTGIGGHADHRRAGAGPLLAGVAGGAGVAVGARGSGGLVALHAAAGGGVAGGELAEGAGHAGGGVGRGAGAALAAVAVGAGVVIVAGGPVAGHGLAAAPVGRVARADLAWAAGDARDRGPLADASLAAVVVGAGVAVVAGVPLGPALVGRTGGAVAGAVLGHVTGVRGRATDGRRRQETVRRTDTVAARLPHVAGAGGCPAGGAGGHDGVLAAAGHAACGGAWVAVVAVPVAGALRRWRGVRGRWGWGAGGGGGGPRVRRRGGRRRRRWG